MNLSRHERKDRLGHGGVKRIARKVNRSPSWVSMVLNCEKTGERSDLIEQAVADELGLSRAEVFPPRDSAAA